jgi:tetratricopeptide (TPR) repeat protein
MAETVLAKMAVEIAANSANFIKELQATRGKLNQFTTGLTDVAKNVGIAFGVKQVASFAFEVAKLSGEAEAVRIAFERLPNSTALMNDLKEATHGTVSELELMKRSVQASNFGIELEALPKLLEFAAIRAQQTGQSVDYLVDSIVTGIGRKSPLILDNLGISAVALKEKMNGVSLAAASIGDVSKAVGEIASDELQKMGSFSENTATKIARLSASWENFKVTLGNVITAGGVLSHVLETLNGLMSSLSGDGSERFKLFQKNLAESIKNDSEPAIKTMVKELNLLRNTLDTPISENFAKELIGTFKLNEQQSTRFLKIIREINGEIKNTKPVQVAKVEEVVTLESLQEKLKQLNEEFARTDINNQASLITRGKEIIQIGEQIKKLEELRKAQKANEVATPETVDAYQAALADLNKELEKTNVNDTARIRVLSAQIAAYTQAIERVEKLKNSFKDFDIIIKPPDVSGLLNPLKEIQTTVGGISFTSMSDSMSETTKRIEADLLKMSQTTKTTTSEIQKAFVDMGPLVAGAISGVAEALGNAAAGVGNFGQNILKVVANFGKQLGEILIAQGVALLAAKFALKNPYTAIAAGVALVAISSALNASVSKAHGGTFGGGSAGGSSNTSTASRFQPTSTEQRIDLSGNFKVDGRDLVLVLDNQSIAKNRLG